MRSTDVSTSRRRRALTKSILIACLGAATLVASGCVLVGPGNGTIYAPAPVDRYVGQENAKNGGLGGYVITLYRSNVDHRFVLGLTGVLLGVYDNTKGSAEQKSKAVLKFMRDQLKASGNDNIAELNRAMKDEEWGDLNGAIGDVKAEAGSCLAVDLDPGIFIGDGENWTHRGPGDDACKPDMDQRRPTSVAYLADSNGTDAEMWVGSCSATVGGRSRSAAVIHTVRRDYNTRNWKVIIVDASTGGSPATIRTTAWRYANDPGRFGPTNGPTGTVKTDSNGFLSYQPEYWSPWDQYSGMIAKWRTDINEGGKWYYNTHLVRVDFDSNGTDDCSMVFPYDYDTVNAPYKAYQWDQPPSKRDRSPPS